ncbi:uncharacterized protein B0H18DRAFT_1115461 [Fomitopsis serialis]|uniref:uncharacterized protein n=1 Tax=Fomitopsis serialis TaxID=139415 RepID=UPI0020079440|nr:uncharacterized protein B0H18DRAFT_1115461 [Neoantrodia serialis]KAH9933467.1 hypothetical protein B0H18DRAFT_1115461 [Neoantrodia serialis]
MLPRVVLCDPVVYEDEGKMVLEGVAEVLQLDPSTDRDGFIRALSPGGKLEGAIGLYERNQSKGRLGNFDSELISKLPSTVKWIAHTGVGYDKVDVLACKERGIGVSNTPGDSPRPSRACEQGLEEIPLRRDCTRPHGTHRRHPGLGGIGLRLAELVHAFPMRVVYHNRRKVATAPEWCEYYDVDHLDDMLAQADVLSVHVPFTEGTRNIVDERMIRKLKKGAVIINTARGQVIDEEAMMQALKNNHLSAVGLDVFHNEPNIDPRWYDIPNAVLLPHVGGSTADAVKEMELRALGNIRDFILSGKGTDLVPELQ